MNENKLSFVTLNTKFNISNVFVYWIFNPKALIKFTI